MVYYVLFHWRIVISRAIEFIETPLFTKQSDLLFTDDEIRALQSELIKNPQLGALIKGTGGLRKVRIATGNKGKSGSSRVIYLLAREDRIYFILAYPKGKKESLTEGEKSSLCKLSKLLKEED